MPQTGTVDFRVRLIDDLSTEIRRTQRITESSFRSMSSEQVRLTRRTHEYENQIVRLRNEQHTASRERRTAIREELRLLTQLNRQNQRQLTTANRNQRQRTGTSFSDRISSGVTSGMGKLAMVAGGGAALGSLATSAFEMSKEVSKVETSLKRAFQSTGEELTNQTAQVRFLSKAYGEDYKQVVQSANALSKEMGISGSEALKLIETGFSKGANETGEFLDMLKEYPAQLSKVGLSADESVALITQQVSEGIYSDKGVDSIKEAGLRLKANNKATQKALSVLDKQTQKEIKLSIAKGDTFKAIQLVSKGLKDTSLSAEQAQAIISDVFGGPGEDAGRRYLETLTDINLELKDVPDNMSDAEKAQQGLTKEWTKFTTGIVSGKSSIGQFFTVLTNGITDAMSSLNIATGTGGGFYKDVLARSRKEGSGIVRGQLESERAQLAKEVAEMQGKHGNMLSQSLDVTGTMELAASLEKIKSLTTAINKFEEAGIKTEYKQRSVADWLGFEIPKATDKDKPDGSKGGSKGGNNTTSATSDSLTKVATSRSVKSLTINIEGLIVNNGGEQSSGISVNTTNLQEGTVQIEKQLVQALTNVVNNSTQQIFNQ